MSSFMKIGRIIGDIEYIGEGINQSFKCIAACNDFEEYPVIAKQIPNIEILKEIICAILGRMMSLPIPEPILLFSKDNTYCFGSINVGYPNLTHYLKSNDPYYLELHSIIKNWNELESAAFFDEFIINPDRHSGNLLYDGKDVVMIDHGLAMQIDKVKSDHNGNWINILLNHLLCQFTTLSCEHKLDKNKLCDYLNTWCTKIINNNLIDKAGDEIPVESPQKDELLSFLKDRSFLIQNIINNKIKPAQLDFVNV